MIVQLGDAARRGLVDPHTVVGGFVELLLDLRRDARTARRFTESDRIRDGLADLGVEVRDTEHGVEWALDSEIGDRESQNP
jgi:cysteinyl-tRNA synthetase